jgi:hypothetical protein
MAYKYKNSRLGSDVFRNFSAERLYEYNIKYQCYAWFLDINYYMFAACCLRKLYDQAVQRHSATECTQEIHRLDCRAAVDFDTGVLDNALL